MKQGFLVFAILKSQPQFLSLNEKIAFDLGTGESF
jgi:hypothetical protein